MSKTAYIFMAIIAILFGSFINYSMTGSTGSSGSRTYIPSGGGGGGFSGGHK
ncbi:hypothetical protein ACKLNO_03040 [Neisseriaceae bacterium B1]